MSRTFSTAEFSFIAVPLFIALVAMQSSVLGDEGKGDKGEKAITKDGLMKTRIVERLQGRWAIIDGVNQGRQLSSNDLEGMYMSVKTNVIATYDSKDNARFQAVFAIDETKKPIRITLNGLDLRKVAQPNQASTKPGSYDPISHGIIKFKGNDVCLLCYSLPGGDKPTKFNSPSGSKQVFFKLRRIGGTKSEPATKLTSPSQSAKPFRASSQTNP
ncbi:MAG: hypothetical protein Aurels2KO_50120 [Aureliella sp.]